MEHEGVARARPRRAAVARKIADAQTRMVIPQGHRRLPDEPLERRKPQPHQLVLLGKFLRHRARDERLARARRSLE